MDEQLTTITERPDGTDAGLDPRPVTRYGRCARLLRDGDLVALCDLVPDNAAGAELVRVQYAAQAASNVTILFTAGHGVIEVPSHRPLIVRRREALSPVSRAERMD